VGRGTTSIQVFTKVANTNKAVWQANKEEATISVSTCVFDSVACDGSGHTYAQHGPNDAQVCWSVRIGNWCEKTRRKNRIPSTQSATTYLTYVGHAWVSNRFRLFNNDTDPTVDDTNMYADDVSTFVVQSPTLIKQKDQHLLIITAFISGPRLKQIC
jgi:hypothetical protein